MFQAHPVSVPGAVARYLALLTVVGGLALQSAAGEILLGPADSIALDQPRVTFGLFEDALGSSPTLIGPTLYNSALLDTGANGVLLGQSAYLDGEAYAQATNPTTGNPVVYEEIGVAGTSDLIVYEPYDLVFGGSSAGTNDFVVEGVTAFGDPTLNLGSFAAIVGMPAMQNRVTTLDLRPMTSLDFIGVEFGPAPAAPSGQSYHIDLTYLDPEYTGQVHEDDPLPTYAHLPLIDVTTRAADGSTSTGTYLLDTGAQTAIIDEQTATDLGIDFTKPAGEGGDVVDYLEVGGVGGTTTIPMVIVGEMLVPTQEGDDLVWTNIYAGVLNIDGTPFDGVFGMNLLTSGYSGALFGSTDLNDLLSDGELLQILADLGMITDPNPDPDDLEGQLQLITELTEVLTSGLFSSSSTPYFDQVVLDFSDSESGVMRLDLNAAVPEPTSVLLFASGVTLLLIRRRV